MQEEEKEAPNSDEPQRTIYEATQSIANEKLEPEQTKSDKFKHKLTLTSPREEMTKKRSYRRRQPWSQCATQRDRGD